MVLPRISAITSHASGEMLISQVWIVMAPP